MIRPRRIAGVLPVLVILALHSALFAQSAPTAAQFLSPAFPTEMVAAKKAERIAWLAYDEGQRNAYTATAPEFRPVRLTRFLADDGTEISNVRIADDGVTIVFVRGSAPNREGWVTNPMHDPRGSKRTIWAVRIGGGPAWELAEGGSPELSPDGRSVLYVKDNQIYRARVTQTPATTPIDKGEEPVIRAWGRNSSPRWSPDGSTIAFVTERTDHSFIGLYDTRTRTVRYLAPSVDRDGSPVWSPDGKQVAFVRRPGLPFGQQAHEGSGSIGNPNGPAFSGAQGRGRTGGGGGGEGGRGGRGGRGGGDTPEGRIPGLYRATFSGGSTLALMVADVATGEGREFWHNAPGDTTFTAINNIRWAGDNVIFPLSPPNDEWDRYYAIGVSRTTPEPILLTSTDGLIEGATSATLSPDGKTLYYCTNAADIEHRHIWAVPTAGGTPRQLTTGEGMETVPVALASGNRLGVFYADAKHPQSVAIVPSEGGTARVITPPPAGFPINEHVVPEVVWLKAEDSLAFSSQLFLPKNMPAGERRPALIFVHGGPVRQMLPGYHYMHFYSMAYAINQWLASQGYVVLSVNYRSGIGYGRSFRTAPNTGGRGNAEYRDVLASGKYLQSRPDVDPKRVGIWGLSYGGVLTAQALARNSDMFVAGVDLAGVHLWGSSLDSGSVSFQSSAIAAIGSWKSPVLLVHGDDDRNVQFSQTVGLVQLLRAHNVYHELIVLPDDPHETLLHSRWITILDRMDGFLKRFVWTGEVAVGGGRE